MFFRGMRYEFLPPYSPDFNPIKPAFSAIKAHIRRNGGLIRAIDESGEQRGEVIARLHEAVWSVTAEDARGLYAHSGYF
jgi:transposase